MGCRKNDFQLVYFRNIFSVKKYYYENECRFLTEEQTKFSVNRKGFIRQVLHGFKISLPELRNEA